MMMSPYNLLQMIILSYRAPVSTNPEHILSHQKRLIGILAEWINVHYNSLSVAKSWKTLFFEFLEYLETSTPDNVREQKEQKNRITSLSVNGLGDIL